MNSQALPGSPDVVVVGGGIIGLALARDLTARGLAVQVLEAGRCGEGATRAAAGMLSPIGEDLEPRPLLELGTFSLSRYAEFVSALEAETGVSVGYRPSGKLEIAFDDAEGAHLLELVSRHGGAEGAVQLLDRHQVGDRVPSVRDRAVAGAWIPGDHVVDNRLMAAALKRACELRGVDILEGTAVKRIDTRGGRVRGVVTEDGRTIQAPRVVLAAGAWGGGLEGLPRPLPVRPVRGQMLSVEGAPPNTEVIATARAYLVPRTDHLIVGATSEEVGFRQNFTPAGQASLLNGLLEVYPDMGQRAIREQWVGFRPGTPDGLPILGEDPELPGLVYATGHFRNGILLTPATVEILGPVVAGDRTPWDLAPFSAGRFS